MNKQEFLRELNDALSALPPKKRRDVISRYEAMIDNAVIVGRDEGAFIDSLGFPLTIAQTFPKEETPAAISLKDQLKEAAAYLIVGLIALAAFAIFFGLFGLAGNIINFALASLLRGDLDAAKIVLYVGHLVGSLGFIMLLIGLLIKYSNALKPVAGRLIARFKGARHE